MIKFSSGLIFSAVFAILFLAAGFYFINLYPVFSLPFFIAFILSIILLHKEYDQQKNPAGFDKNNIPKEIKIRYPISSSLVTILTYSIFPAVAIFGLIISRQRFNLNDSTVFFIIALFLSIFILASYLEMKKKSKTFIIISDNGIQLGTHPNMQWKEIQQEKIITRNVRSQNPRRDGTASINYLYLFYNEKKIEVNIDDFDVTDDQLAQILKIFRARFNDSVSL
ncbi:hypothetical protein [Chryseobacterium sp. MEBOG07]|uniref:hypothetical protein n=1 Tax=Chryseobacterium sp. MEBOG07 TaxID=2879939 RepID=UPI001F22DA79|nr:hypothetical protein [Chryseobacterium sp. MEBOG07]UKB78025.1 hypothetical protein LF886_16255 [Chryseobacterium sp. MEBOG07]